MLSGGEDMEGGEGDSNEGAVVGGGAGEVALAGVVPTPAKAGVTQA